MSTNDPTSTSDIATALPRRRVTRLLALLAVLAALGAVVLAALPAVIGWQIERALLAGEADSATVDDVDFNPFAGTLAVRGVDARAGDRVLVRVGEARVRFRWVPLIQRTLRLNETAIADVEIGVERRADAVLVLAGLAAAAGAEPEEADDARPWKIDLVRATLDGVRARYEDTAGARSELAIERLAVENVSTARPDQIAQVSLAAALDAAPIRFEGTLSPSATAPRVAGTLTASDLALGPLAAIAAPQPLRALEGTLDAELEFDLRAGRGLELQQRGHVAISALAAAAPAGEVRAAALRLDGTLEVDADAARTVLALTGEDAALEISGLSATGGDAEIGAARVRYAGSVRVAADDWDTGIEIDGRLETEQVAAAGAAQDLRQRLDSERGEWSGSISATLGAGGAIDLEHDGSAMLGTLSARAGERTLALDEVGYQGTVTAAGRDSLQVRTDGTLRLAGLDAGAPAGSLRGASIRHEGTVTAELPRADGGTATLRAEGTIAAGAGEARRAQPADRISWKQIEWNGTLALEPGDAGAGGAGALRAQGTLAAGPGEARRAGGDRLAWETVEWNGSLGLDPGPDAQQITHAGRLALGGLSARSGAREVSGRRLAWEGSVRLALGSEVSVDAEGALSARAASLAAPDALLRIAHEGLDWKGRWSVAVPSQPAGALAASHQGTLSLAAVRMASGARELSEQSLEWEGTLRYRAQGDGPDASLHAEGALAGGGFEARSPGQALEIAHERLDWEGSVDVAWSADAISAGKRGRLALAGIRAVTGETVLEQERLAWDGDVDVTLEPASDRGPRVSARGAIESVALAAQIAGGFEAGYQRLDWDGSVDFREAAPSAGLGLTGELEIAEVRVRHPAHNLLLLGASTLRVEGIGDAGSAPGTLHVARARIADVRVGQAAIEAELAEGDVPALFRAASVTLEELRLGALRDLAVGDVEVREGVLVVRRNDEGRWLLLEDLLAAGGQGEDGGTTAGADPDGGAGEDVGEDAGEGAGGTAVRIERLALAEGSRILFRDESVSPPYDVEVRLTQAELSDLDTDSPAQKSPLSLRARQGEYTEVALSGWIKPFAERLTLHLEGDVNALEIPPLSSYTGNQLGYNLTSGQLNAELELGIEQGELDGDSRFVFNNISVAPQDPKKMEDLTEQLSVPLDTALSLLRDEENNIRLSIPVSGDVADPQFDLSDAINQAVGNAMKAAAVGVLKLALQPYGALITIATLAGEKAGAVRLDPVEYPPGSDDPGAASTPYLEKLHELMGNRPELRIRLCGKATVSDRAEMFEDRLAAAEGAAAAGEPAAGASADGADEGAAPTADDVPIHAAPAPEPVTEEELIALARTRAEDLKSRLVNGYGIAPERLFICHPEYDETADANPRVELLI